MLEDVGEVYQLPEELTSLTHKSTIDSRLVVPRDHHEVDRKSGSYDGKADKTLDCVVEQRKHHKERHDHEETDRQQKVHLSASAITQLVSILVQQARAFLANVNSRSCSL